MPEDLNKWVAGETIGHEHVSRENLRPLTIVNAIAASRARAGTVAAIPRLPFMAAATPFERDLAGAAGSVSAGYLELLTAAHSRRNVAAAMAPAKADPLAAAVIAGSVTRCVSESVLNLREGGAVAATCTQYYPTDAAREDALLEAVPELRLALHRGHADAELVGEAERLTLTARGFRKFFDESRAVVAAGAAVAWEKVNGSCVMVSIGQLGRSWVALVVTKRTCAVAQLYADPPEGLSPQCALVVRALSAAVRTEWAGFVGSTLIFEVVLVDDPHPIRAERDELVLIGVTDRAGELAPAYVEWRAMGRSASQWRPPRCYGTYRSVSAAAEAAAGETQIEGYVVEVENGRVGRYKCKAVNYVVTRMLRELGARGATASQAAARLARSHVPVSEVAHAAGRNLIPEPAAYAPAACPLHVQFVGPQGSGKTTLGCALEYACICSGLKAIYVDQDRTGGNLASFFAACQGYAALGFTIITGRVEPTRDSRAKCRAMVPAQQRVIVNLYAGYTSADAVAALHRRVAKRSTYSTLRRNAPEATIRAAIHATVSSYEPVGPDEASRVIESRGPQENREELLAAVVSAVRGTLGEDTLTVPPGGEHWHWTSPRYIAVGVDLVPLVAHCQAADARRPRTHQLVGDPHLTLLPAQAGYERYPELVRAIMGRSRTAVPMELGNMHVGDRVTAVAVHLAAADRHLCVNQWPHCTYALVHPRFAVEANALSVVPAIERPRTALVGHIRQYGLRSSFVPRSVGRGLDGSAAPRGTREQGPATAAGARASGASRQLHRGDDGRDW